MIDLLELDNVVNTMSRACIMAGILIQKKYGQSQIVNIYNQYHIKLDVDAESHNSIAETINKSFPRHIIVSEEADSSTLIDKDHVWIIDPLEGTSNYFLRIPYYGISIAYFYKQRPIAACLLELHNNDFYVSVIDRGTTLNGIHIGNNTTTKPVKDSVLSVVVDYTDAGLDYSTELIALFSKKTKRVLTNWAPTIDLSRVATNLIDVFICVQTPFENICAGLCFVQEVGGIILNFDGSPFRFSQVNHDDKVSLFVGLEKSLLLGIITIIKKDFISYSAIL